MLGTVTNVHSVAIDTALYTLPVLSGKANFKRLTFDLGLGAEFPVGGDFLFTPKQGLLFLLLIIQANIFLLTTMHPLLAISASE